MTFQLQRSTHIWLTRAIAPIPMPVYNEVSRFYQDVLNHGQTLWEDWEIKMEQTRDIYAKFIGADNREEIAFTHSTSEGMNIIAHMLSDKGIVISNELEFPSSNLPWLNRDKDNVKFVKAKDDNKIQIENIATQQNSKTGHQSCAVFYWLQTRSERTWQTNKTKRTLFCSESHTITWSIIFQC